MPLKCHWMQLPREVVVGEGVIEQTAEISKRLGFTESTLIITGKKTHNIAGKIVEETLEREGVQAKTYIVESATIKDVEAVEEKIRALKPQVVFGVGGGTKIDIAKLSSARQRVPF
ncbi:iron-containing alcohol dehydrogenase, partial [Candidatus Bathyarchaeota archaeon]|nr:iron-containing alcohol dehydrogenase [Candidatus Bathyarchaeota archaeon]